MSSRILKGESQMTFVNTLPDKVWLVDYMLKSKRYSHVSPAGRDLTSNDISS